jgi:hypothetical protein
MKSISDKAEVSVDFPDKTYMGSFGHESSFDVKVEDDEVLLRIVRAGQERREFALHLHYLLLADVLKEIGQGLAGTDFLDDLHRHALQTGVEALASALKKPARRGK